ncbi:MAG: TatD family hydrolase [Clostridiales bacterium]|jgi:TatD DNase family protein|nr:TatD family hydrolase [Clostridiales bacterium]
MRYFESHAHYDDNRFDKDRDRLLSDALPNAGIDCVINVGADMRSSYDSIKLAEDYDYIYASVGVHPHDVKDIEDRDLDNLLSLSKHRKAVAIGEIGLDFHYDHSPRDVQRRRFRDQLALALEAGLPVIIHSREADRETFDIIKDSGAARVGGVIHCYGGGAELAAEYAKLGFYIGFGGVLTYPKAEENRKAAAALPADYILIETDCPYLSPVPFRGQRNDSRNLRHICEKLAEIRGITPEEAASKTYENGKRLFNF